MSFVEGTNRDQETMFPPALEDYVSEDNPVRVLDAFIGKLDMVKLEFQYAEPKETGRRPYDPADMLRLYVYGYLNRVRSSRRLEQETHRNVEVMWLMRNLRPDHKTIAEFRRANKKAIRRVFREFSLLCRNLGLFGKELVAIDGSKFRANNSKDRNYDRKKLGKIMSRIDQRIDEYLGALDAADKREAGSGGANAAGLREKMEKLEERREECRILLEELDRTGASQISVSDPDSRSMKVQTGTNVCYNVQTAVDDKHKLIVTYDVTNEPTDRMQLSSMAIAAKEELEVETLSVMADTGYSSAKQLEECEQADIEPFVPRQLGKKTEGMFSKTEFRFDRDNDTYVCPAGQVLPYRFEQTEKGRNKRYYYKTEACAGCALKTRCTTSPYRRITRVEGEEALERSDRRLRHRPDMMRKRKAAAEHPFGTLKRTMDHGYFLTRGLESTLTEFSLSALAYNFKRVLTIVGAGALIDALSPG